MTDSQQPLIEGGRKPKTIRKTRDDTGRRRKPDPTEREAWRKFFRDLPAAEKTFELGYLTAITEAAAGKCSACGKLSHDGACYGADEQKHRAESTE